MTKYCIEVLVRENGADVWKPVRPTHGEPYTYDSEGAATEMARKLYPVQYRDKVRVAPFTGH